MSDETTADDKPRTTKSTETPFERAVAASSTAGSAPADAPEVVETEKPAKAPKPAKTEAPRTETPPKTEAPPKTEIAAPVATPAASVGAQPQVIYVTQPTPPPRKGNRGFGALIALLSGLAFGVLLALAAAAIGFIAEGTFSFAVLTRAAFYAPILLFILGFVLLVLIANRASWWAFIIGSIFVGLFVYFGTVGIAMLGPVIQDPGAAGELFRAQLLNPFIVVAGLLAREVSMWVGAAISRRGRAVRVRNAEARAAYEQDMEEKRAERERLSGVPA